MRGRFKSSTGYRLTTSPRDSSRISQRSEKPTDMRNPKRVRFVDGEMDGVPVHDSPERCEATQSPRSDAPKTSEFAYFWKVKSGAIHGHSSSLHNENEILKSSNFTETSSAFGTPKPVRKGLKMSVSGERAPSDRDTLLPPRVSKYGGPDHRKRTNETKKRSPLLYENMTPVGQSSFSSPTYEASENSENVYNEKGIFSAKRHKLRQLAAQTLFTEAEKVHPKGFDFVYALMSRLFPKDDENNNDSSKGITDSNNKLIKSQESNNREKGLHLSHKRDFDFSFCLPSKRRKSTESFHFNGLDEFNSITIDHPIQEIHPPLIEWDSEWGKGKTVTSFSNHEATNNSYPTYSPSLSNYFLEFDSSKNTQHDFGTKFDDTKCALTGPRQISRALPSTIIVSSRDRHCFKNKIWDDDSDFLSKRSDFSAADYRSAFDAEQLTENERSLFCPSWPKEAPLCEGAFYRNFLSSHFRPSVDAFINRPLLLDHVSRDRADRELYFDDDDIEFEYR